jgi:NADH-quinone oxidoreductase subunit F
VKGLWDNPTNINNVETFANVPWIIANGAKAFATYGTANSKGTKVFAMAGKVRRGGLVEVPMGISIRDIVFDICGGIKDGKKFKAVQMGGPSGGCIPAELQDTVIDYESINKTGAIMGSGGLVVMDDATCMVEVARFFLDFTQRESCGKCTFCRIGTKRMLEVLTRITTGQGKDGDIELLLELAERIRSTSLCGLGQTAPNPVLTTLKYFRSEYEAHIANKKCPAHQCSALLTYTITDKCTGCMACIKACKFGAIMGERKKVHVLDPAKCTWSGPIAVMPVVWSLASAGSESCIPNEPTAVLMALTTASAGAPLGRVIGVPRAAMVTVPKVKLTDSVVVLPACWLATHCMPSMRTRPPARLRFAVTDESACCSA